MSTITTTKRANGPGASWPPQFQRNSKTTVFYGVCETEKKKTKLVRRSWKDGNVVCGSGNVSPGIGGDVAPVLGAQNSSNLHDGRPPCSGWLRAPFVSWTVLCLLPLVGVRLDLLLVAGTTPPFYTSRGFVSFLAEIVRSPLCCPATGSVVFLVFLSV